MPRATKHCLRAPPGSALDLRGAGEEGKARREVEPGMPGDDQWRGYLRDCAPGRSQPVQEVPRRTLGMSHRN
eukprot:1259778-Pyramimonas_sp.AAC.1